jgi:hypothetical protein
MTIMVDANHAYDATAAIQIGTTDRRARHCLV